MSVFVNNLREHLPVERLCSSISSFIEVVNAFIHASIRRGKWSYLGFVHFKEMKLAMKAIDAMHDNRLCGSRIAIKLAICSQKEESKSIKGH